MEKTPPLPREYAQHSQVKAWLGIAYTFGLIVASCAALGSLWSSSLPLWVKVVGALPFGMVGGYGILLSGFMGHDGTHFTLHENKVTSAVMGILLTAPIFPYLVMGFSISHWNHHKYTNLEQDPDSQVFSKFKTFLSRALLARPFTFYVYGSTCVKLALGIPLPYKYNFPLEAKTLQRLAQFNIAANLLAATVIITFGVTFPVYGLAIAFLFAWGSVISGLSPFIEHTGTQEGRGQDTRTSVGAWWDIFILGNNYHIEHHLYPTVPFYNLKRAHLYLKSVGYYDQPRHVSTGFWDTYRYTLSAYPYP